MSSVLRRDLYAKIGSDLQRINTMQVFLEDAGLTGRKLEVAMKALKDNMVDTVDELRILSERDKDYDKVLPVGFIRALITTALENQAVVEVEAPTKPERGRSEQDAKITRDKNSSLALPEGKR